MENQSTTPISTQGSTATAEWTSAKVYVLGLICLVLGIAVGALVHGPSRHASNAAVAASPAETQGMPPQGMPPQMTGQQALNDPVFEKAEKDPNNFDLLEQAGVAAIKSGDPQLAISYYVRALKVKDDLDTRTDLANAYFRAGNPDKSLAELAKVLNADPKNDKALYNIGMVKLIGKNDPNGAIASWQDFLKYHPDHPYKAQVQEMIRRVQQKLQS